MTHSEFKRLISLVLSAALLLCLVPATFSRAEENAPDKEEVVYANLNSSGAVEEAYVVNIFNLPQSASVTDYGDYESVVNLTNTSPIAQNGIELAFHADAGRFYYQGNLNAKLLPWNFSIGYTLDGKTAAPQDLGGASGKLGIHLTSSPNSAVDKSFYENYMLQISVTLDAQKCMNIVAEGATAANAGANKILTFTVMPDTDGDISISADVIAFEMPGISINAVPLSIQIEAPDTEGLLGDIDTLADSIGLVNDGVSELTEGIESLKNGAYSLKSGASAFGGGLGTLSGSSGSLSKGSQDFCTALNSFASGLSSGGGSGGLGNVSALTGGLSSLAAEIRNASSGLSGLKSAVDGVAATLNGLSDPPSAPTINDAAAAANPDVQSLLSQYNALAASVATAKGCGSSLSSVSSGISSAVSGLDTIANSLDGIASQLGAALSSSGISAMIQQLQGGATQLAAAYVDINNAIDSYTYGVTKLNNSYGDLQGGINSVYNGIAELFGGAEELNDGTAELEDQTSNMDEQVSDAIDDILSDYDRSDFIPSSFVSIRNTNVTSVQFIIQTAAIELPEEAPEEAEAAPAESFWDRLLDLFRSN